MYHYGMTQWIVGNEPLEISCKRMQDCGYNGIEFAAEPGKLDWEECNALMDKYHLNCHSLCGLFDETRDLTDAGESGKNAVVYLKDCVDFAEFLGAKIIIVVPSPVGRTVKPANLPMEELTVNCIANVREAAEYAKTKNIKFAIEAINRYETYFVNTLSKALDFVQKVNHPNVGLMADLFHMSIEERSIPQSLFMVRDHLLHVHVADNTREAAGLGSTDFKEVLRTLKSIGYNGSLTMEFMYRLADPYAAQDMSTQTTTMDFFAKQAIDYMKMVEKTVDAEL